MAEFRMDAILPDMRLPPPREGVEVRSLPFSHRWSLRASPTEVQPLSDAWGAALPTRNLTSSSGPSRHALRLGPDEWLLLSRLPGACDALARETTVLAFSLVDVSHRNVAIEVAGASAAMVLNAGVPLDLSDEAFPGGCCTRTVFGKVEVVLWRPTLAPVWRVEFQRSFADYVGRYLNLAVGDLT
jgi:sarcosine oxidase subunit gamma